MEKKVHRNHECGSKSAQDQGFIGCLQGCFTNNGSIAVACGFVAPVNDSYANLNDYSAVLKLSYGETSFLFTGDAERVSERDMIDSGVDLKADVLKVAHHGSSTSTSAELLVAVAPFIAVIFVGKGNDYGHPSTSVIDRLVQFGIKIYRTGKCGSITMASDGSSIEVTTEKECDDPPPPPPRI